MSVDDLTPAVLALRLTQAVDTLDASPDLRQRVEQRRRLRRRRSRMEGSLAASVMAVAIALVAIVTLQRGHQST